MNQDAATYQKRIAWMLGGAALGALTMFMTDPDRGRRRRALATDKIRSAATRTGNAIDVASRDLGNRMQGLRAQATRMLSKNKPDVHERAEEMPGLQGGGRADMSAASDSWSPGLRALAMIGGGALGAFGLTRRSPAGMLYAAAGMALMARGISNMPFRRMAEAGIGRQAISRHKTIHIEAPPDRVFDIWSKYENFPRFMSNIQEVRDLGNGRSHWVVRGPLGAQVEWDAVTTESRRPEMLAWRTEPGSTVQHEGTIRFEPEGNGTRVSVQMSYSPPAGAVGHAVASLFGADPKREMDEDLMRMKTFIETGNVPSDAAQPGPQPTSTLH